MTGTTGTKSGTGVSGTVATGALLYSGAGTVVGSKVAKTDGQSGEWQQVVFSGPAAANWSLQLDYNGGAYILPAAGWAVGDTLTAACEVQTSGDWSQVRTLSLGLTAIGGSGIKYSANAVVYARDTALYTLTVAPGTGVLMTKPLLITSGATSLSVMIGTTMAAGGASTHTVQVGRCELRKQSW
jgi:hypothetical protein